MWGSYPIAELRMSSYKNTKINYIPDHVIIRDVENVLNNTNLDENETDIRIKNRLERSIDVLLWYSKALTSMREWSKIDLMKHAYGM